jgi:hypothetical protein
MNELIKFTIENLGLSHIEFKPNPKILGGRLILRTKYDSQLVKRYAHRSEIDNLTGEIIIKFTNVKIILC